VSQSSSTTINTSPSVDSSPASRRIPFFFREENSNLIVKGNFMTLSAKPEFVEKGEWLAHQGGPTSLGRLASFGHVLC